MKIIEHIMYACFRFLGKYITISDEVQESLIQFVKFGIIGVSNTVISYLLYTFSLMGMRTIGFAWEADYLIAQVIAFVLSVLWSFYWNNKFVFVKGARKQKLWMKLLKTYVSYSFTGLFLNSFLLIVWVQYVHISEYVAPILNLLISVPLNFVINKFWAFKG